MSELSDEFLKGILEAALLAAGRPLSLERMVEDLFEEHERPSKIRLRQMLDSLAEDYRDRAFALREVGSGYRIQVRSDYARWISRLWEEKPGRYSRALMETLALIAYRQPITRGEIEEVRGVAVSTQIIKTLQEREWVRVIGHRDVPGKPALYATTRQFLDYFDLTSLDELPTLAEIRDIESINAELDLGDPNGEMPVPKQVAMLPVESAADTPEQENTTTTDEPANDGDQPLTQTHNPHDPEDPQP
ncbi:MAG: SMC-Scp complex subunit ScpB [Chromatiales bacterium]|nr:SMC-Scp complex subunit ScpB [Chromatiales bacterium]